MGSLKDYQKQCIKCNLEGSRFEKYNSVKFSEGYWCKTINAKCSLNTCPQTNTTKPSNISNKQDSLISYGNEKLKKELSNGGAYGDDSITERQSKVLLMYENGMSMGNISKTLNVSKGSVQKLIYKAIRNAKKGGLTVKRGGLTIAKLERLTVRLHNDEFLIKVLADYRSLDLPIKNKGRNIEYKIIKCDGMYIKLHKNNTLTFRFIDSIYGENEEQVLLLANKRCKDFLDTFSIRGVTIVTKEKLLSRHYAIVGSGFARKVQEDRLEVIIFEDGKVRIRLDNSNDTPEIDTEHPVKAKSDSEKTREYLKDLIDNPHYMPSEIKEEVDNLKRDYIKSVNEMTEANKWMAENFKSHKGLLEEMKITLKAIQESVKR